MSSGIRLNLRLFLEGVEVPIISANVSYGVKTPASAQLSVVETPEVFRLGSRTLAHVFFFDDTDDTYKLLFAGEVVELQQSKNPGSRSAVLQCLDFTSYWDAAKRFYYDSLSFDVASSIGGNFQGAKAAPGDVIFGPAAALCSMLKQKARSFPDLKGVLNMVVRLLESIGGYHEGEHTRGISDFFTIAQLRLKLYQQVGASQLDTTSERLINSSEFHRFLQSVVSQGGHLYTMRQVLEGLMKVIFYNWVSLGPARFITENQDTTKKFFVKGAPENVVTQVIGKLNEISAQMKPRKWTAGTAEHLYVNPVDAMQAGLDDAMSGLLRSVYSDLATWNGNVKVVMNKLIASYAAGGGEEYRGGVPTTTCESADALFPTSNPETCQSTASNAEAGKIPGTDSLVAAMGKYKRFLQLYSKDRQWTETKTYPKERLYTTLFVPDIFFCPPPKCNILFPEQYERLIRSRNFLNEVSRLMITVPTDMLAAGDADTELLGKQFYFAPDVKDVKGKKFPTEARRAHTVVLPHEVLGGPIPVLQMFSDIREYDPALDWSGGSILSAIEKEQGKAVKEERGCKDPIPYLQHVADWLFIISRYQTRQGMIPLKFNPYVVPGMPALIVDKYMLGKDDSVPEQVMCVPMAVVHAVSQSSAITQVSVAYVRGHREDSELFNVKGKKLIGYKTSSKVFSYVGTGADVANPKFGGTVLNKDDIASGKADVVEYHAIQPQRPDFAETIKKDGITSGVSQLNEYRTDLYNAQAAEQAVTSSTGQEADFLRAISNKTTVGVNITEKVTSKIPIYEEVDIPFEDQVRPPWLSPLFMNSKIGDFYKELLGIGAITDRATEALRLREQRDAAIAAAKASKGTGASAAPAAASGLTVAQLQALIQTWKANKEEALNAATRSTGVYETVGDLTATLAARKKALADAEIADRNIAYYEGELKKRQSADSKAAAANPTTVKHSKAVAEKKLANSNIQELGQLPPVEAEAGSGVIKLKDELTVADCVDDIVRQYSEVRCHGSLDQIHDYVMGLVKRPIATMEDVLGSENLTYKKSSTVATPSEKAAEKWSVSDPATMKEGFHSGAFAKKPLDGASDRMKSDVTGTKPLPIDPDVDPREQRRQLVEAYLQSLLLGPGLSD